MFFDCPCVDANLQSVIEMKWDRVSARAGYRPFHALSIHPEGSATIFVNGKDPIPVEENAIVFVPARMDFAKEAGPGRILAVHFFSDSLLPREIRSFRPRNPSYFDQQFRRLLEIWTEKEFGYEYEAKILFDRVLLEIEREWAQERPTLTNAALAQACRYLHEHFTDPQLSMEQLSRMCGMSDTYFRRLFRREFHETPIRYLNRLRLRKALELLQSGAFGVGEVSEKCGFNNIHYFSAFIKRETGLNPSQCRKKLWAARAPDLSRFPPEAPLPFFAEIREDETDQEEGE